MLRGALTDPAASRRREAAHDAPRETAHDACMRRNRIDWRAGAPLRAATGDDGRPEKIAFGSE
jgi:hypothetical protein